MPEPATARHVVEVTVTTTYRVVVDAADQQDAEQSVRQMGISALEAAALHASTAFDHILWSVEIAKTERADTYLYEAKCANCGKPILIEADGPPFHLDTYEEGCADMATVATIPSAEPDADMACGDKANR